MDLLTIGLIIMCVGNFGISAMLFLWQRELLRSYQNLSNACDVNNANIQTVNRFCQILNDLYISIVKNKEENDTTEEVISNGE